MRIVCIFKITEHFFFHCQISSSIASLFFCIFSRRGWCCGQDATNQQTPPSRWRCSSVHGGDEFRLVRRLHIQQTSSLEAHVRLCFWRAHIHPSHSRQCRGSRRHHFVRLSHYKLAFAKELPIDQANPDGLQFYWSSSQGNLFQHSEKMLWVGSSGFERYILYVLFNLQTYCFVWSLAWRRLIEILLTLFLAGSPRAFVKYEFIDGVIPYPQPFVSGKYNFHTHVFRPRTTRVCILK